jgi:uncharacterized protein (TIGR02145 family)
MKKILILLLFCIFIFTSCKKGSSNPIASSDYETDSTITYSEKIYHKVKIGTQTWLKENLDVGTMIHGIDSAKNNGIIEKYCYNDSIENCDKYGGLYQWDEAMQYVLAEGTKGICPTGWHIPTNSEFQTLDSLENQDGNSLKAVGQGTGAGAGTNTSGFSVLLTGFRNRNGFFDGLGVSTYFWSSTEYNAANATIMYLGSNDSYISFNDDNKDYGFSVRCAKDF